MKKTEKENVLNAITNLINEGEGILTFEEEKSIYGQPVMYAGRNPQLRKQCKTWLRHHNELVESIRKMGLRSGAMYKIEDKELEDIDILTNGDDKYRGFINILNKHLVEWKLVWAQIGAITVEK